MMTILKASPEARKTAIYLALIIIFIGVVIIQWGMPYFEAHLQNLPPQKALQQLSIGVSVCCLSLMPIGFYFYRVGRKVISSEQCPPPGIKVIHDTMLHTGLIARRRGFILAGAGVLIMIVALFESVYFPLKMNKLTNDPITNNKSNEGLHRLSQTARPR